MQLLQKIHPQVFQILHGPLSKTDSTWTQYSIGVSSVSLSFQMLKRLPLVSAPILRYPDTSKTLYYILQMLVNMDGPGVFDTRNTQSVVDGKENYYKASSCIRKVGLFSWQSIKTGLL